MRAQPARRVRVPSEHTEQANFITWVQWNRPEISKRLFAVPNGARRSAITGARFKAEGMKAGVSDLILLWPSGQYHGLVIEFKQRGETMAAVSDVQMDFLRQAEHDGYAAAVAFGNVHAQEILMEYLQEKPVNLESIQDYLARKKNEQRLRARPEKVHGHGRANNQRVQSRASRAIPKSHI